MPAGAPEPKVKGVAFRTIEVCFERWHGAQALERARKAMPGPLAEAFQYHTLLAASWYPIAWYRDTFRTFRASVGGGREFARELGRLAAKHDMAGVHKQLFAKFVSPQALLGMSQRFFSTYYDTGTFEIVDSRTGFVSARCWNCLGWDENMWLELAGSCESLLTIAGARNVDLRVVSGGSDGSVHSVFEATWI